MTRLVSEAMMPTRFLLYIAYEAAVVGVISARTDNDP